MKRNIWYITLLLASLILAGCPVVPGPSPVTIKVTPDTVTLEKNKSQLFKAELSNGQAASFTWSANAGTLSSTTGSSVNYTAPSNSGDYRITVDSVSALAPKIVNVKVVDQVSVLVTPSTATLAAGDTISLTASLDSAKDSTFSWEATGGSLSSTTGKTVTFTAPNTPGLYTVIVKSPDASKDGTANIRVAVPVDATDSPETKVLSGISGSQAFIIDADDSIFTAGDYMTIELGTSSAAKLSVFDKNRNLVAVSDGPAYFTAGSSTGSLETQDIGNTVTCRGPCVNIENTDGSSERYYIQIEAASSATYDVYAFSDPYQDSTEPGGETDCEVTSFPAGEFEFFALETLGDVDCILSDGVENRVILETVPGTAMEVKADIYDGTTLIGTLKAGPGTDSDSFSIVGPAKNFRVLVRSSDGRAGPSATSRYKLAFNTP